MNRHQFQILAKTFRAGKITLEDFSDQVIPTKSVAASEPMESESSSLDLLKRKIDAHKGDFGRALIIGGSDGMAGAICLTGLAALRSGSGLVTVVTPKWQQKTVAGYSPCYMTVGLDEAKGRFSKSAIDQLDSHLKWADVIAIGPGMGQSRALQKMMAKLYANVAQPMIIDADGLNNLAAAQVDLSSHAGLRILTPHPGEFQKLAPGETTDRNELEKRAQHLALENDVTIVLKGHKTMVTNGDAVWHNRTGNPGMATGGSGDVLTGIIASLVGQGMPLFEASQLGVEKHGMAGDLAAAEFGQISLISSDLIKFLPQAFQ